MGVIAVIVVEGEEIVFQVKGHGVRLASFFVPGNGWPWQGEKYEDQGERQKRFWFQFTAFFGIFPILCSPAFFTPPRLALCKA